jgi:hypothetical protein
MKPQSTILISLKLGCIVFICGLFNPVLLAQDEPEENVVTHQFWVDYNSAYRLTERWDLYGDIGFRTISPHKWNRYIIRPAVRYQVPKLIFKNLKLREEFHAGVGFFFTDNMDAPNRLEIRPFQGIRIDWPDRTRIRFRHYVRLEERFDLNTSDWVNTFGLRLRYLAELTIKLQGDLIAFNKGVYLPISVELFWNLIGAKQFNDHLRLVPGIGYEFSKKWKAEFNLGYHYVRNTVEEDFATNDIVYRLRVRYRIK